DLVEGCCGQVQASACDKGASVVDAYGHRLAVAGVGDLDVCVEGQRFVCGCHRVGVEGLAVGGGAAGQVGAVEGGFAGAPLPCGFWVLVGGGVGFLCGGVGFLLGLFFFLGQVGALGAG